MHLTCNHDTVIVLVACKSSFEEVTFWHEQGWNDPKFLTEVNWQSAWSRWIETPTGYFKAIFITKLSIFHSHFQSVLHKHSLTFSHFLQSFPGLLMSGLVISVRPRQSQRLCWWEKVRRYLVPSKRNRFRDHVLWDYRSNEEVASLLQTHMLVSAP